MVFIECLDVCTLPPQYSKSRFSSNGTNTIRVTDKNSLNPNQSYRCNRVKVLAAKFMLLFACMPIRTLQASFVVLVRHLVGVSLSATTDCVYKMYYSVVNKQHLFVKVLEKRAAQQSPGPEKSGRRDQVYVNKRLSGVLGNQRCSDFGRCLAILSKTIIES